MLVVYYVDGPAQYLREQCRVLRPGGVMALTGRVGPAGMERVLQSYLKSLEERGLTGRFEREIDIFRERFKEGVKNSVSGIGLERMKRMLTEAGFVTIEGRPNPYFGQCYSLLCRK